MFNFFKKRRNMHASRRNIENLEKSPEERTFNFLMEKELYIYYFTDDIGFEYFELDTIVGKIINTGDVNQLGKEFQDNWYIEIKINDEYKKFTLTFNFGDGDDLRFTTEPISPFKSLETAGDLHSVKFYTTRTIIEQPETAPASEEPAPEDCNNKNGTSKTSCQVINLLNSF